MKCKLILTIFSTGTLTKSESTSGRRIYGTSTRRPTNSNNRSYRNNIHSINSIAPANPTQDSRMGSRYTPPISISESYSAAARNSTQFRPFSGPASDLTSPRPYLYSTGLPASFKPVYYRVTTKPTGPPRKTFEEDYYDSDYDDEDSSLEDPQVLVNQHLRNNNNLYVRPILMSTQKPTPPPSRTEKPVVRTSVSTLRAPPNTRNTDTRPSVTSFNIHDVRMQSQRYPDSSKSSSEEDRLISSDH